MRLDKYLKVSRIIKRRKVAHDSSVNERIFVNGKIAKPSLNLKINDIISVHYFKKTLTVKVKDLNLNTKAADAASMYEIVSIEEED
ncbi:MAG: RNA-binding S4 domain-containing protein [Bacilli bacterium]|nr:RNA-binding S4 domain-containing protein [Bacilli bacterium]